MSKLIGFVFLAVLAGTSVVAWSRSTGPEKHPVQMQGLSPLEMHRKMNARELLTQQIDDQSVVFTKP